MFMNEYKFFQRIEGYSRVQKVLSDVTPSHLYALSRLYDSVVRPDRLRIAKLQLAQIIQLRVQKCLREGLKEGFFAAYT